MICKVLKQVSNFCSQILLSKRRLKNIGVEGAKMKTYNAAVFFIDILGFSFLTKGQIQGITEKDYESWGVDSSVEHPYSYLAATILIEFRDALLSLKNQVPGLNVAQISDCAFIWSADVVELLKGVHKLMWTMVKEKGILCRGGLSYGEIVTIDNSNNELGAFVVGDAVSRAAKNESKLKGPRITMDMEFPRAIWNHSADAKSIEYISHDLFHEIQSEINMDVVDEYRWYLCDDEFIKSQTCPPNYNQRIEVTKKRLTLASVLKFHPKMGWNSRGKDGLVHLQAGVQAISKNGLLGVLHLFETQIVMDDDKRSVGHVNRLDAKVMGDRYFKIEEKDKWNEALTECD